MGCHDLGQFWKNAVNSENGTTMVTKFPENVTWFSKIYEKLYD